MEQKIHVQSIKIPAVKFIASSKSTLIATQNNVYKLEPRPYDGQILCCIDQKQFDLALCLAVSGREGKGGGRGAVEKAAGWRERGEEIGLLCRRDEEKVYLLLVVKRKWGCR